MPEEVDEAARGEPGIVGELGDTGGLRSAKQMRDGIFDKRGYVEITGGALQQDQFNDAEFCRGSRSREDAFVEFASETAPELGDVDILIVKFSAGHFEKRESTRRAKGNADDAGLLVSVDGDGVSAGTGERDGAESGAARSVVWIVKARLIFRDVDDQRHAAIRHQAFFGLWLGIVLVIPDLLDKTGERRTGSEKQAFHSDMVRRR